MNISFYFILYLSASSSARFTKHFKFNQLTYPLSAISYKFIDYLLVHPLLAILFTTFGKQGIYGSCDIFVDSGNYMWSICSFALL